MTKMNYGAVQRRPEHWQEILGRWQGSGLSQAAFCRRHSVPVWRMARWRKRLAGERGGPTAPFVPVGVIPAAVRPERLELVLRGERCLRFSAELDAARLREIVAALDTVVPTRAENSTC